MGSENRATVLVVEDDPFNLMFMGDLLEVYGYRVLTATEPSGALDLARRHRPDLILMDIQLREASGLAVARMLKQDERLKSIPIVAVTAFALSGDRDRMLAGGCQGYLAKPFSCNQLLDTVAQAIDGVARIDTAA